jgi:cell division protein FtsB
MRWLTVLLLSILVGLQYPLWFGRGGWFQVSTLERQLQAQLAQNEAMALQNQRLGGEVTSLQNGAVALEERARYDLGLIKKDEVFVQFVAPNSPLLIPSNAQSLIRKHGRLFAHPERVVPDPPSRAKPKVPAEKKNAVVSDRHKKKATKQAPHS